MKPAKRAGYNPLFAAVTAQGMPISYPPIAANPAMAG
jgi:hypothetical protein